jgi:hypothetical protein
VTGDTVDDLASALVDGQLGADDADAARRRPDVVARARKLEATRAALRSVPAPDPAARERALAAATAAFDEAARAESRPPPPPSPVDLAAHRHDRHPERHRAGHPGATGGGTPRWLVAAAAIVAVVMGLAGLAALSSGDGDSADISAEIGASQEDDGGATASADDDADEDADDDADGPSAAPEGGDEEDAARSRPIEAGDLGTFRSAEGLVDHLADIVPAGDASAENLPDATAAPEPDQEAADALGCDETLPPPLDDPTADHRLHGTATVDGREVDVWVVDTGRGRRAVAIDTGCSVVVDRPLP